MDKRYFHKKTGKPYTLITDKLPVKENRQWRYDFCLYKAEYENPDGPYFVRTKEDFFENFVPITK